MDLSGKDYFTDPEAAHYCCVSMSQFRTKREQYGIIPFLFMGKVMYRKADLQKIIEAERLKQWQQLQDAGSPGISTGRRAANSTGNH